MELASLLKHAALLIEAADGIIVTAGAGMGVDSGLPDFRGPQGFWRAYPGLKKAGLRFEEIASPHYFETDPALAWGFYGHRLNLYRSTVPHEGFRILLELGAGTAIPSVRIFGERQRAPLVRINPADPAYEEERLLSIPAGALAGLKRIVEHLPA
jgi:hypothetical protein